VTDGGVRGLRSGQFRTAHHCPAKPRGRTGICGLDRDRCASWLARRPRTEAGRRCDHVARPVPDLDIRANPRGQVKHWRQVGSCPAPFRSHAAPAATAIALVSSACCRVARAETSAAANAAVSPARSAIAARATEMNASASRRPRGAAARCGPRAAVSHRGLGPAGIRRPSRSARSPGCPRPAQPCDAGS
jgi:hypothetical protein